MTLVLGIAGGGTKSRALLADQDFKVLAKAEGGPANYQAQGRDKAKSSLLGLLEALFRPAGLAMGQAVATVAGLAGASAPEDAAILEGLLRECGLGGRISVVTDARVDLEGGTGGGPGVLVIAGTGSMAYGLGRGGLEARAGGYGQVLSDEGSGYQLSLEGIQAVLRAEDGREPSTTLRGRFLNRLNFDRVDPLRRWFFAKWGDKDEVAGLAPELFAAAQEGDEASRAVLRRGAEGLASMALAVIARAGLSGSEFPLVLSGGVLAGQRAYAEDVAARVRAKAPGAAPMGPREDGAMGALRLAREFSRGV